MRSCARVETHEIDTPVRSDPADIDHRPMRKVGQVNTIFIAVELIKLLVKKLIAYEHLYWLGKIRARKIFSMSKTNFFLSTFKKYSSLKIQKTFSNTKFINISLKYFQMFIFFFFIINESFELLVFTVHTPVFHVSLTI